MLRLADAAEQQGSLLRAARTLVAAGLPGRHGLLPEAQADEATQRALRLLEGRLDGDGAANQLELDVLDGIIGTFGSSGSLSNRRHAIERVQALQQRRKAASGSRADRADLKAVAQAAFSQYCTGMLTKLGYYGTGTAEDAQRPPAATEIAEAAEALVAIARARVGGGGSEWRLPFFCLPRNRRVRSVATLSATPFCFVCACRRSTGCR